MRVSTRFSVAVLMLGLAVAVTGCVARLAPAPEAVALPGPGSGAVARADGVQISARPDAWRGVPGTLEMIVTPVLVTIENNGKATLRVRRDDFGLVAADGSRYVAKGPYEIDGFATEQAPAALAYPRFGVGIGIGAYRGRRLGLGSPFGDSFWYDDHYYPMTVTIPLPTADMVQMALAERVLAPGERVEGFLYFDRVNRKARRVDFTVELVDATSGARAGTVTIPFVVQ